MFDVTLELSGLDSALERRGLEPGGAAQVFVDSEILRLSDPYVPKDTGMLIDSAITATVIGSGEIVYAAPYAKKLYYNPQFHFQGAPMRGAHWAERMAADHLQEIVDGAAQIAGGRSE